MGGSGKKMVVEIGRDGLPKDDVTHYSANAEHLLSYERAAEELHQFKVPLLLDQSDPHSYLIFGLLDGTGNDVAQDPLHATSVAKFRAQIERLNSNGSAQVHAEYIAGPGTQKDFSTKLTDGAFGHTSLERAEKMYAQIVTKAQEIFEADPDAKLNLHLEGFSRGASEVPLLARIIHDRGIPDTRKIALIPDEQGHLVERYTRFHQSPGQTPMSVGLYDPVPTGIAQDYLDRRLPPSVVSGFEIDSAHERRGLFPVDRILPEGLSEDGRFLRVAVAGAHSNIGGSYLRGGLGDRSFNLMTDYHNGLFSTPLLQRLHETDDPRMNVIHRSEEGNLLFRFAPKADRATAEGQVQQLTPDYSHVTPTGQVVHLPVQTAEPLDERLVRHVETARFVSRSPLPPEPGLPAAEAMYARVLRDESVVLKAYDPGKKVLVGAGIAGGAVSALEAVDAGDKIASLLMQDNLLGAQSELRHYAARGTGGWIGGAATGFAVGWETGPGVIAFVAVGAVAGSQLGERYATWRDNQDIYTQTDRTGTTWEFTGRAWHRQAIADTTLDQTNNPREIAFAAGPEKARELNYLASNASAALAMREAASPRDPFTLPAGEGDRSSLAAADWKLDPQTGDWHRDVVVQIIERGQKITDPETANPERAAELNQASTAILQQNIVDGPAAIAARYEAAYRKYGWDDFGAMPLEVQTALSRPDVLTASDGKLYRRQSDGEWVHDNRFLDDSRAQGRLRHELDTTSAVLHVGLAQHAQQMAEIPSRDTLSPDVQHREHVTYMYRIAGMDLSTERLDAVTLAMQRTREEFGLTGAGSIQLKPGAGGEVNAESPIAHLQRDSDGVSRIKAVTTTEDIQGALAEVRARGRTEDQPTPDSPEQRIAALTPQERDAHTQAQREANRQGLSQPEANASVQMATIAVTARGIGARRGDVQLTDEDRAEVAAVEPSPQSQPTPQPSPQRVEPAPRDRDDAALAAGAEEKRFEEPKPEPALHHARDVGREDEMRPAVVDNQSIPASRHDEQPAVADPRPSTIASQHQGTPEPDDRVEVRSVADQHDEAASRSGDQREPRQPQHEEAQAVPVIALERPASVEPASEPLRREPEKSEPDVRGQEGVYATAEAAQDKRLGAGDGPNENQPAAPLRNNVVEESPVAVVDAPQDERRNDLDHRVSDTSLIGADRYQPDASQDVAQAPASMGAPATSGPKKARQDEDEQDSQAFARESRTQAPLMTEPGHSAHLIYLQAHSQITRVEAAPGMGLTQHEKQTLGASAVAEALSAKGWNFTGIDHVVPSNRIEPQTGRPEAVFVVQGELNDPAHRRIAVNMEQALSQTIEQSSTVAQTVQQTRQQTMELEQSRAEAMDMDGPKGPVMRMGSRTSLPPPNSDMGDGGGGE